MRIYLNIPPLLSTKQINISLARSTIPSPCPNHKFLGPSPPLPLPPEPNPYGLHQLRLRAGPTINSSHPDPPNPRLTRQEPPPSDQSPPSRPPSVHRRFHHLVQQSQHPQCRTLSPLQILLPLLPTSHTLLSFSYTHTHTAYTRTAAANCPPSWKLAKVQLVGVVGKAPTCC